MTLLFIDGMDTYTANNANVNTEVATKWSYASNQIPTNADDGPHGTECITLYNNGSTCGLNIDNEDVLIFQANVKWDAFQINNFLMFKDTDASIQVSFYINATGKLEARRSTSPILGTSSQTIVQNVWHYLEVKVKFHQTTGTVLVHIDGVEWLNLTGLDTCITANEYANRLVLFGGSAVNAISFDDIILMNDAGSINNDFIGNVKVETLRPSGAGTTTQYAPSAGSNYQNTDDPEYNDGDSTYNDGDNGEVDTFAMGDLSTVSGTVLGVQTMLVERKTDAGVVEHRPVLRSGGTDYGQTNVTLADSYETHLEVVELDPDTAGAWDIASINAVEMGYERTT